jgi:hypothetical protein
MALPELAVMQQTFELLHQLDPQARRRVLKWVKSALEEADPAPAETDDAEAPQAIEPGEPSVTDEPAAAAEPAAVEAEAPAAETAEATTPAAETPAPAADRPARRATKKAAKPTSKTTAKTTAKTAAKPARGRAKAEAEAPAPEVPPAAEASRRGRPPADEIMRVYQQVDGKLTELAKHYGKPYGTIQGWASTLREQGYPIGRSRKS